MKPISSEDQARRLKLRVAAKLMAWLGLAAMLYVLVAAILSGDGEVPSVPSMKINIGAIEPGEVLFDTWEGRPVLVYRRTDQDVVNLRSEDERLVDPQSRRSDQPESVTNAFRSASADWFVAIALGTDLGCSLDFLPASSNRFQGKPWQGGFVDSCRKARYDTAGRVFESQYATRNLAVPVYSIAEDVLVLGRK